MPVTSIQNVLRGTAALLVLGALAGCSSLNVGESDFSCSGMPGDFKGGEACKSARDIYEMTKNGEVPDPVVYPGSRGNEQSSPADSGYTLGPDPVTNDFVTPALPNRPVPIRTPAKVMRISVFPWEDKSGSLNVPGYVYTEIEPRRWTIADTAPTASPTLRPLQMGPSSSDEGTGQARSSQKPKNSRSTNNQRPWDNG